MKKFLLEKSLQQLDYLGGRLEMAGITDKVNRHNLVALAMAEQQYLQGELESASVRIASIRIKAERLRTQAVNLVTGTVDYALSPVTQRLNELKSKIG